MPLFGGVSRPSVKQWTQTSSTPFLLRHLEQRIEVRQLRVYAALAGQAQQMQAARAGVTHGGQQDRVAEEVARFDHQVDAHHVHQQHAAGADIEMAHFAVAHLPLRQADGRAGGVDQRVRKLAQQPVIGGLARGGDRVALDGGRKAPAVEDGQDQGFGPRH